MNLLIIAYCIIILFALLVNDHVSFLCFWNQWVCLTFTHHSFTTWNNQLLHCLSKAINYSLRLTWSSSQMQIHNLGSLWPMPSSMAPFLGPSTLHLTYKVYKGFPSFQVSVHFQVSSHLLISILSSFRIWYSLKRNVISLYPIKQIHNVRQCISILRERRR